MRNQVEPRQEPSHFASETGQNQVPHTDLFIIIIKGVDERSRGLVSALLEFYQGASWCHFGSVGALLGLILDFLGANKSQPEPSPV